MENIKNDRIRFLYEKGLTQQQISEEFGVSRQYIAQIENRMGISRIKDKELFTSCAGCSKTIKTTKNRMKHKMKCKAHFFCSSECKKLVETQKKFIAIEKYKNICCKCKKEKENLLIHQKYYYICRQCNNELAIKYRSTEKGKKTVYENNKKFRLKYPEKNRARSSLNMAVRNGRIKKPKECSICKNVKTLHAHHSDYSKPLDVMWLCISCHANLHRNLTK